MVSRDLSSGVPTTVAEGDGLVGDTASPTECGDTRVVTPLPANRSAAPESQGAVETVPVFVASPQPAGGKADTAGAPGPLSASAGVAQGWGGRAAAIPGVAAGRQTQAPLTFEERITRARIVEEEANRQVERLDRYVGLSSSQAAAAFVAYAQASPSYDAQIPIEVNGQFLAAAGAEASSSADQQIYSVLTDEQQAALGQEMLNRDLWWTEIVTQLASDFPAQQDDVKDTTAQPSEHQVDNIFDLLNSAN